MQRRTEGGCLRLDLANSGRLHVALIRPHQRQLHHEAAPEPGRIDPSAPPVRIALTLRIPETSGDVFVCGPEEHGNRRYKTVIPPARVLADGIPQSPSQAAGRFGRLSEMAVQRPAKRVGSSDTLEQNLGTTRWRGASFDVSTEAPPLRPIAAEIVRRAALKVVRRACLLKATRGVLAGGAHQHR